MSDKKEKKQRISFILEENLDNSTNRDFPFLETCRYCKDTRPISHLHCSAITCLGCRKMIHNPINLQLDDPNRNCSHIVDIKNMFDGTVLVIYRDCTCVLGDLSEEELDDARIPYKYMIYGLRLN